MLKRDSRRWFAIVLLVVVAPTLVISDERPFGLTKRIPWTSSKVRGRPEPPLPFRARRIFSKVNFENPTVLTSAPGTSRLFIAQQAGKIYSIPDDQNCTEPDLFLDVADLVKQMNDRLPAKDHVKIGALYGLTFHPDFAVNRFCYVCHVVSYSEKGRDQHPHGTRVVRLKVTRDDPPRAVVDSEVEIITWLQGGHNGGCLKFALDGKLFISTGDGGFAYPPDGRYSGQDVSNLLSAVLRIDVDHPDENRNYSIPPNNPLLKYEGARGEIWAYGMRNPWKISVDRKTGDLWVGDVGWQLWELVYRVRPGDNYGWSLVEGRQPVHTEGERGPTPIVPPTVEIPHTDGVSVTGGFVYRGNQFPELRGRYLFGDWETRRIWGVEVQGDKVGPRVELVEPTVRIVGFAERNDGELLLLDYDSGSIHELVRSETKANESPFPRRLSDSGLFMSVAGHEIAPGVIPFSINAALWADHATAQRFLALPDNGSIGLRTKAQRVPGSMFSRQMDFPKDAVLAKTLSLELVHGDPTSRRRIETQLLHFNGYDWRGYSYRWNDEQTDAELVDAPGTTITIDVDDPSAPDGKRRQPWRFSSRMECIRCHNQWAEFTLAFNVPQINRDHEYGGTLDNQIRALRHIGVLKNILEEPPVDDPLAPVEAHVAASEMARLADPFDESADMDLRGRAYLHANCAHCHREHGGGAARIHIAYDTPLGKSEALATRPTQGTFGIHNAEILAPGDPLRSVLYYRLAKAGPGHMPHLGATIVDRRGLALVHDWIRQLPMGADLLEKFEKLRSLDETTVLAKEKREAARTEWRIAREIATTHDREMPTDEDKAAAARRAQEEAAGRVTLRARQRLEALNELLETPRGAMLLARGHRRGQFGPATVKQLLAAAASHGNLAIRDLFEPFLLEDQKVKRLGDSINPESLLAMTGNAKRGRDLFLKGQGIQCRNCHRVGKEGKELGPELTQIGKKLDRRQLLESMLQPSKTIDPKFRTWLVETASGKVLSGLLVSKDDKEVVLRDAQNKQHRFAADEIDGIFPQQKSMMPDLLLRDMSAEQVADLLAWLESLK